MSGKKIILKTDPESATYMTDIKGWVSRDGMFFGDNATSEEMARWRGRTHDKCECGFIYEKSAYTICEACRDKKKRERYEKLELVEWDEETPLCCYQDDTYFYSIDEIDGHCFEFECSPDDMMLVLCEKIEPRRLDPEDFFTDQLDTVDGYKDLPEEIKAAADRFNEITSSHFPSIWVASDKRVRVVI